MNNSAAIELTGKVTVVALVILFLVVLFLIFLHFYAKWFYYRREEESLPTSTTRRVRRRQFGFAAGDLDSLDSATAETGLSRGLNPSVLKSIPTVIFEPKDFKLGIECAVCLSDLAAGEEARILPKCNHGFHVDCIDMWFESHSTCPICRNPVSVSTQLPESTAIQRTEDSVTEGFPTNVLFYGDQSKICNLGGLGLEEDVRRANSKQPSCSSSSSSSFDHESVIDIPDQNNEDGKSPVTTTTRARSLKRLLSRDRRANPPSNSFDAEPFDQIHS